MENLVERELILHRDGPLAFDAILLREEGHKRPVTASSDRPPLPTNLDEAMAAHISEVLRIANGKIHGPGGAAELLGMNPNTLRWRLDKLGISYRRQDRKISHAAK